MLTPSASASSASAQTRSSAVDHARPGPPSTGHVMSTRAGLEDRACRRGAADCSSRSNRIGVVIASWCACSGVSSSRLRSEPTPVPDAHHDRLADRVDRRVGDLREELLEVVEQRRLTVARARPARASLPIEPIGSSALAAIGASRTRRSSWRVAERALARVQRLASAPRAAARPGRSARWTMPSSNHSPYGCAPATSRLTSSSSTITPRSRSTRKSLPGCRRPLRLTFAGALVHHAGLRAQDDPAVLGLQPAAGAQAVAVERRADHAAVGEGHRRGAVPRLHQARVEGVEALEVVRQVVAGPRRPPGSSSSPRAAGCGRPARAARARCRTSPSRSRRGARPGAPSAGRRRTARRRAATRGRASS